LRFRDPVVNVSQVVTLNKDDLSKRLGALDALKIEQVAAGLRLVLDLQVGLVYSSGRGTEPCG
jgi:mRNA-degrading endonuclease toxin of MazEF toxin-antitoxin module